jgi:hypothetical protein
MFALRIIAHLNKVEDILPRVVYGFVSFASDACANRIVGWKVSRSAKADFVLYALEQTLFARKPTQQSGLIIIQTADRNMYLQDTPNVWPKRASNLRSEVWVTLMITPWLKP